MRDLKICPVSADHLDQLANLLSETVASGGSVSFLHPLGLDRAKAFWAGALSDMAAGDRVVLGAFEGEVLAATVTLVLGFPDNQPHRAEIAKMMTAVRYRGRGIARDLMHAAETLALQHGKSLLVLDTAAESGAAGLYTKLGYTEVGTIPDFALKPHGGLSPTILFWKRIGGS